MEGVFMGFKVIYVYWHFAQTVALKLFLYAQFDVRKIFTTVFLS